MATTEQIIVELFYAILYVPTLIVGAIAVPIAGSMLLLVHRVIMKNKITLLHEWRYLLVISSLFAITEFTWYDAVGQIGAGKTALINLPLETVSIVILAWIFLRERLNSIQIFGASIVMVGVVISLSLDVTKQAQFGIGEIESIIASLATGVQTILIVKLLFRYSVVEVTAFSLIISGLMLQLQWVFNFHQLINIQPVTWIYLLLTPIIPMLLFLSQFVSFIKVGASLTSVITSSSIILTVVLQLILVKFAIPVAVPQNIAMALIGGLISIAGIYIMFTNRREINVVKEKV
jgi:drug/metabolite transporter (DMT)-like permease